MKKYLNHGYHRLIPLVILILVTQSIFAQSYEYNNSYKSRKYDIIENTKQMNDITLQVIKEPYKFEMRPQLKMYLNTLSTLYKYYKPPIPTNHKEFVSFSNRFKTLDHRGFTLDFNQSTNFYPFLLDARSVSVNISYRRNNLLLQTNLIANKYGLPSSVVNQFGINGNLTYSITPTFTFSTWVTYYNNTPYHSLGALPYISTNSYGGWFKYEADKAGIKLGVERYYDTYERRWITQPIVSPVFKIKKVKVELPFGPLLLEVAKDLLQK